MKHIEFDSPATMLVAERVLNRVREFPVLFGARRRNRFIEEHLVRLRAVGLMTHDAGDRFIVTPGSADVEGIWRRSRAATREHQTLWHADATRYIAGRDAEGRKRRTRQVCRRFREEEDLAAFAG